MSGRPVRHYPGPISALAISLAAWWAAAGFIILFATPGEGSQLGMGELGVGEALGLGLIASLAARSVPAPQAERLGLRGFQRSLLVPLLLLLPLAILASELVNIAHALYPPPDLAVVIERQASRLQATTPLGLLETAIVVVGIAPVVEEWLYRGVIQQGLVAHLGRWAGVSATACLFGLAHFEPSLSLSSSLATFCATLPLGFVLGMVRLATGSLLAAILLHAALNAVSLGGLVLAERLPVAGFNAPGAHTSLELLAICALPVFLGLNEIIRRVRTVSPTPPLPQADPSGEDPA